MILDDLKKQSIAALKARDRETRELLGGVIAKFLEVEKSGAFTGWSEQSQRDLVAAHVKQLSSSLDSLAGTDLAVKYQAEIDLLAPYMPQLLDEAATRALVAPFAERANGRLGPFIGMVMKGHKGDVDPALVRKIGAELGLK